MRSEHPIKCSNGEVRGASRQLKINFVLSHPFLV